MMMGIVAGQARSVSAPLDRLVREYFESEELTEDWSSLGSWFSSGVQVSGSRLYGISGGNPVAAGRPFAVAAGGAAKVTAEITISGSNPGAQYVGFSFGGGSEGVLPSLPNFAGIGVGTASRYPNRFVGASFSGVSTGAATLQAIGLSGTCRATVTVDADNISLVLQSQDGGREWSEVIPRSAAPNGGVITSVVVWNGASNGTSGHYIKALGAKKSLTPFRTKSNAAGVIQGNASVVLHKKLWPSGDTWRIELPATYAGDAPTKVCLVTHQATTGTRNSVSTEPRWSNLRAELLNAGYALLSADDLGDRWGSVESISNYQALYEYVSENIYSTAPYIIGVSMGGLAALALIGLGAFPVARAALISPVCDVRTMRANPSFQDEIDEAWGSNSDASLAAASDGYNPMTIPSASYAGASLLFIVGSADEVVSINDNTDAMLARISNSASATKLVLGGSHNAALQFSAPNILAHFNAV